MGRLGNSKVKNKKSSCDLEDLYIGGECIRRGERKKIEVPVSRLYDFTELTIPIEVIRGKKEGPVLLVCAAVHGDEINGVEIIRRLLLHKAIKKINGTLIVIPIVNVFGFNNKSRYLPDRRDLNRSFPGASKGSLTAQLANFLVKEVLYKCTHCIDLHTGAVQRSNLPQIRGTLDSPEIEKLAKAFHVPVILNTSPMPGSLRAVSKKRGIQYLVFEGGEALRFDEKVIHSGLNGILSIMTELKMVEKAKVSLLQRKQKDSFIARSCKWARSPSSGIFKAKKGLGDKIIEGDLLGIISDPFGATRIELRSETAGIIIGASNLPLVSEGDAIFNIASFKNVHAVKKSVIGFEGLLDNEL